MTDRLDSLPSSHGERHIFDHSDGDGDWKRSSYRGWPHEVDHKGSYHQYDAYASPSFWRYPISQTEQTGTQIPQMLGNGLSGFWCVPLTEYCDEERAVERTSNSLVEIEVSYYPKIDFSVDETVFGCEGERASKPEAEQRFTRFIEKGKSEWVPGVDESEIIDRKGHGDGRRNG